MNDFNFIISTYPGLEKVLAKELTQLGARSVEANIGNVSCIGDKGFMYKANFCLRTATTVMLKIKDFNFSDADDIASEIALLNWGDYLNSEKSFSVKCSASSYATQRKLFSETQAEEIIKNSFSDNGNKLPVNDFENPDVEINIAIGYDKCSVMLNSSGAPLYNRGYRSDAGDSSINEVLAAGIVMLSGWEPHRPLVDFICNSAIIPIEAALYAAKIPPGAFKKNYAFEKWIDFEPELFQLIREKQIDRIIDSKVKIFANESDKSKAKSALENIQAASVEDMVTFSETEFTDLQRPESGGGTVIIYLPREKSQTHTEEISSYLKNNYTGFRICILTDDPDVPKVIGLKSKDRVRLHDDKCEYRLLIYEL